MWVLIEAILRMPNNRYAQNSNKRNINQETCVRNARQEARRLLLIHLAKDDATSLRVPPRIDKGRDGIERARKVHVQGSEADEKQKRDLF